MAQKKLFKIFDNKYEDFIKSLFPTNADINKGLAIKVEIESFLGKENKYRKKIFEANPNNSPFKYREYAINVNIDDTKISEEIKNKIFPVRTLRSFIAFFFCSTSEGTDDIQNHTLKNLEGFLKCFAPIKGTGLVSNDKKKCNDLIKELQVSHCIQRFKNINLKIIGKDWNLSIDENISISDNTHILNNKNESNIKSDQYNSIESIEISGATTINKSFCNKIKEDYNFTPSKFYNATQDYCQWYGVINQYDYPRKEYFKIKELATKCFENPLSVISVVHGLGGSGKSTLLRRLAVELCNESFVILWVNEREFETIFTQGVDEIKSHPKINYLMIIEDWYRLIDDDLTNEANTFVRNVKKISHLRLVVGDRNIKGKEYLKYTISDQIFHLTNKENKSIIDYILIKNPKWSITADKIFKETKYYNSTLFLLLFILSRLHQNENNLLLTEKPINIFERIVVSDFKLLYGVYPGLAKMLFYWASIYKKQKYAISYDCFLQLADHFNNNTDVSKYCNNLSFGKSEIYELLRVYINIDKKQNKLQDEQIELLQFNHDTLAEYGIAKANKLMPELDSYNDNVKIKILDKIISIKNEPYSTSLVLGKILTHDPNLFSDKKLWLQYAIKLLDNNYETYYLDQLPLLGLERTLLDKLMSVLFEKDIFPVLLWLYYLKKSNNLIDEILNRKFTEIPSPIYRRALFKTKDLNLFNRKSKDILETHDIQNVPEEILFVIFKKFTDGNIKQKAISKILEIPLNKDSNGNILTKAISLTITRDIRLKAISKILNRKNIYDLNYPTISVALGVSQNIEDKERVINRILSNKPLLSFPRGFVNTIITTSKNQEHSRYILKHYKTEKIPLTIISTALNVCENQNLKRKIATNLLENIKIIPHYIIVNALSVFKNDKIIPEFVTTVIEKIIIIHDRTKRKSGTKYQMLLIGLMTIPFHKVTQWKSRNDYLLKNWIIINRSYIYHVILGNRKQPETLLDICRLILERWEHEILQKNMITLNNRIRVSYGNHVKIALQHPKLRDNLSIRIGKEIKQAYFIGSIKTPEYIVRSINDMLEHNLFSEWDSLD